MLLNEIKLLIQIFTVSRFVFKKILYVQLELFHVKITCIILSKLDKRLNKYKSRLNDYHHKIKLSESTQSHKYIIQNDLEVMTDLIEQTPSTNPVIIAEKPIEIMNLTIQQALMKMDLENLPALLFTNSDSKRLNVVYYRKDGNISWIDSK